VGQQHALPLRNSNSRFTSVNRHPKAARSMEWQVVKCTMSRKPSCAIHTARPARIQNRLVRNQNTLGSASRMQSFRWVENVRRHIVQAIPEPTTKAQISGVDDTGWVTLLSKLNSAVAHREYQCQPARCQQKRTSCSKTRPAPLPKKSRRGPFCRCFALVEPRGVEPLTSSLRTRRSPN
jgi:hypothetical protein